jgi:protein SCO1/2
MRLPAFFLLLIPLAGVAGTVPAGVGFEQRIGERLPLEARFSCADGLVRPLGAIMGEKPAILVFNYFRCPEMCSLVSSGTIDAIRQLKLGVGADFTVITVSIDPTDTVEMAREHRLQDIAHYGRPGAGPGWNTLVGDQPSIERLATAAGFHYAFDPRTRQYAHPSGLVVVTPRGRVAGYFLGVDYDAQGLAEAIRRAASGRTGESVFNLVFLCFQGGAQEGAHARLIWAALSVAVIATVAVLFGGIAVMLARERRQREGDGTA